MGQDIEQVGAGLGAEFLGDRHLARVGVELGDEVAHQRAQETLKVCQDEVKRLEQGVDAHELKRAITGLKSHIIMQGESTTARASAIAHDFYRINRARSLDELAQEVDQITLDKLNSYLASRDFGEFTIYTVGSKEPAGVA